MMLRSVKELSIDRGTGIEISKSTSNLQRMHRVCHTQMQMTCRTSVGRASLSEGPRGGAEKIAASNLLKILCITQPLSSLETPFHCLSEAYVGKLAHRSQTRSNTEPMKRRGLFIALFCTFTYQHTPGRLVHRDGLLCASYFGPLLLDLQQAYSVPSLYMPTSNVVSFVVQFICPVPATGRFKVPPVRVTREPRKCPDHPFTGSGPGFRRG